MPVLLSDVTFGASTLKQIRSGRYSLNGRTIPATVSGQVDPAGHFAGPAEPRWNGQSSDVAGVIAALGLNGSLVSSGTIVVPHQKLAEGAGIASGSNHARYTATDGFAVIEQIRANQDDEEALADVAIWFLSTTGLTDPITEATGAANATQTIGVSHALGPCLVDGSEVEEVVGATVSPGLQVTPKRTKGANFPQKAYGKQRRPFIDLEFENFDDASGFTSAYKALSSATVYLRKRSGAGFVADATLEHIALSFTDSFLELQQLTAQGNDEGRASVRIWGRALTMSATSAIS